MTLTEHLQPLLDKRFPAALVAGMLFAGAPVWANDHLEPVVPVARFDEFLRYVFASAFKQDVVVSAFIDRSWDPPDMVGISKRHGVHRIFALDPRDLPEISDEPPPEPFAVEGPGGAKTMITPARRKWPPVRGVRHCEIALDTTLAERIESVWTQMVLATRQSTPEYGGTDGVSYTFSTTSPEKQGWAWSPLPATKPGVLARIAETMIGYCRSRNGKGLEELTAQVASLEKKMK
jgi:hypothetical protein